jgi:hypothetical protein
MPHRFATKLDMYSWLEEISLNRYDFEQQPHAVKVIQDWFFSWIHRLFFNGPRPLGNILGIWGGNGLGKTTLARAIARYHLLNIAAFPLELIMVPVWVSDQFNGAKLHPNWDAPLLILDDLDGLQYVPKSMDTWLLDRMGGYIKYRSTTLYYPTIVTSNRDPADLSKFLMATSTGKSNPHTIQSAVTMSEAITRSLIPLPLFATNRQRPKDVSRRAFLAEMNRDYNGKWVGAFKIWEPKGGNTLW